MANPLGVALLHGCYSPALIQASKSWDSLQQTLNPHTPLCGCPTIRPHQWRQLEPTVAGPRHEEAALRGARTAVSTLGWAELLLHIVQVVPSSVGGIRTPQRVWTPAEQACWVVSLTCSKLQGCTATCLLSRVAPTSQPAGVTRKMLSAAWAQTPCVHC